MIEQNGQNIYYMRIYLDRIESIKLHQDIGQFRLEITRINPHQQNQQASDKQLSYITHEVSKRHGFWNEIVQYNNCNFNHNWRLILFTDKGIQSGEIILEGSNYFKNLQNQHQKYQITQQLVFDFNQGRVIAKITIFVSENHDFMASIYLPSITLASLKQQSKKPQRNAIQTVNSFHLNCFSCMDQVVPGFDNVEVMAKKIKKNNIN